MTDDDIVFFGEDWSELSRALGVESEGNGEFDDSEGLPVKLAARLSRECGVLMWCRATPGDAIDGARRTVALTRRFVEALTDVREEEGTKPLWRGLLAIEDDYTFLQYARTLLPLMWS